MSGGLLASALLRETGKPVSTEQAEQLQRCHAEAYARQAAQVRPLPGARDLLAFLTKANVPWAIATSGRSDPARQTLQVPNIGPEVPVVTRRPGTAGETRSRPVSWLPLSVESGHPQDPWWSETVCGICWLRGAQEHLGLVYFQEATDRMNLNVPGHVVLTRSRTICCNTWMRLVFAWGVSNAGHAPPLRRSYESLPLGADPILRALSLAISLSL